MNANERESRVLRHQPMVRFLGARLKQRLPSWVELDELVQVGMIAVWTAPAEMPRPFLRKRIWWAMIDSIKGKNYREPRHPSLQVVRDDKLTEPADSRPNVEQRMIAGDEARTEAKAAADRSARLHLAIVDKDPLYHRLTRREQRTVKLRYGNRVLTQQLTAKQMNISQRRVSQLEHSAFGRLQRKLAA